MDLNNLPGKIDPTVRTANMDGSRGCDSDAPPRRNKTPGAGANQTISRAFVARSKTLTRRDAARSYNKLWYAAGDLRNLSPEGEQFEFVHAEGDETMNRKTLEVGQIDLMNGNEIGKRDQDDQRLYSQRSGVL